MTQPTKQTQPIELRPADSGSTAPVCEDVKLGDSDVQQLDVSPLGRVLKVGNYVVGEAHDPLLSGHPHIRY